MGFTEDVLKILFSDKKESVDDIPELEEQEDDKTFNIMEELFKAMFSNDNDENKKEKGDK